MRKAEMSTANLPNRHMIGRTVVIVGEKKGQRPADPRGAGWIDLIKNHIYIPKTVGHIYIFILSQPYQILTK